MVESPEVSGFPDLDDFKNFLVASGVTGLAFASFYGDFSLDGLALLFFWSSLVLLSRELGIRAAVAQLDAYVDLEVSSSGATTTLMGAIVSVLTGLGAILLFPVYNEVERKSYENWGKDIDVIWAKYSFFVYSLGIISMLLSGLISHNLGLERLSQMYALFTFFQMMPFDYSGIPTGPLDGAYIIRFSGFYWLLFMGVSIVAVAFTV